MNRSILFFAVLALAFFTLPGGVWAKADLSLLVSDITFSKDAALAGEKTRIFARIFNLGDEDVSGFVIFTVGGRVIGESQAISVKVGTYDDVFIDWVFNKGNYNIGAGIIGTQPPDENADNNLVLQKSYFVDSDVDQDGVGDRNDNDSDNDGLNNDEESALGTDLLKFDTDGDKIGDKEDAFPLDKTEWQDNDRDGLGDNIDTDDDNDSLTDEQELVLGTNIFKTDTDGDLIPDKTEVKLGFLNPNRNEWKIAGNYLASVTDTIKAAVKQGNAPIGYLFAAFGFLSVIFLISRFLQKK